MIPNHVSEQLKNLSKLQNEKFNELVSWAGQSGMGTTLPVDYDRLLDMVRLMGEDPIVPIPAPPVEDAEEGLKVK